MGPKITVFVDAVLLWLRILHPFIPNFRKLLNTLQVKGMLYKQLKPYMIYYLVKRKKKKLLRDFSEAKQAFFSLCLLISKLPRITRVSLHILDMPCSIYSLSNTFSRHLDNLGPNLACILHKVNVQLTCSHHSSLLFTWLLQCFQRD